MNKHGNNLNHWVAASWTQSFILLRPTKSVPKISGIFVVKSKLLAGSGYEALSQLNPIHNRGHKGYFKSLNQACSKLQ